jgi:hypothetical protein
VKRNPGLKFKRDRKINRPFSLREKARKREYKRRLSLIYPLSPTLSRRERG